MSQTSYSNTMPIAVAGMKADAGDDYVRTYVSAEASAEIPYGVAICQGSTDDAGILPVDANSKLVGVLLKSDSYAPGGPNLGTTGLKPKTPLDVMYRGAVYVQVEEAVAKNDPAFFRHTASGGNTQKGKWRKSADTASAVLATGCYFLTSASSGGFAQLWVDIPTQRAAEKLTTDLSA